MPNRGQVVIWCAVALLGVAVVMINSAAMSVGTTPADPMQLLTGRTTLYALLAVAVMIGVSFIPIDRVYRMRGLANPAPWLLMIAVGMCVAALIPGVGAEINSSRRWMYLGPKNWGLTFQPSELAKWTLVIALSWWAARHAGAMSRLTRGLLPLLAVSAVVCGLVIVEDLGTAVLMGAVVGVLLIAGGARWRDMALCVLPAVAAVVGLIVTSPYRLQRVLTFLDPFADAEGSGYQTVQMLSAIAGGSRGLGNGVVKLGYLPADTTDAIFAVICEELGLAGAALVMAVYLVLVWTSVGVVRECRSAFGRLLVLGVVATIAIQALINIAVVTVVVPTKGIALPLLSSGGTGWVMTGGAIGLIAAVDRWNRKAEREAHKSHHAPPDSPPRPAPRGLGGLATTVPA